MKEGDFVMVIDKQTAHYRCLGTLKVTDHGLYLRDLVPGRLVGPFLESQLVEARMT